MKKLTKQQRLEAYVYCWFELKGSGSTPICWLLESWLASEFYNNGKTEYRYKTIMTLFPEFRTLKPVGTKIKESWFKGVSQRLRAIETCIRLCEQSKD